METTKNKFFIFIMIDYHPREHISQYVTTVLRDQGEWQNVTTVLRDQGEWHLSTGDQHQQQQQNLIIVR